MHKNLKQIILWPKKALIIKGKLNDFLDKAYICRVYPATACQPKKIMNLEKQGKTSQKLFETKALFKEILNLLFGSVCSK